MTINGAEVGAVRALQDLRAGAAGVERWNASSSEERLSAGPFREVNLSGTVLAGVNLGGLDCSGARLAGANLSGAWLLESKLEQASLSDAHLERAWCVAACFRQADLSRADLRWANLRGADCVEANFAEANLTGANLDGADLRGANLLGAVLTGASVLGARYDGQTRFPKGFSPSQAMVWTGGGPPPVAFDLFVKRLNDDVDPKRLGRALEMLKAERFKLYSRVDESSLCGVVKSQTDEGLVYSCRLDAQGWFACCSQDLELCLGLRNALCKHLLVLVVGLARSNQIDPALVSQWVKGSRNRRPQLDAAAMTETFLRYKSAEAGEIDWRPTETIPEDYYSL